MRRFSLYLAPVALVALLAAGCGGGGGKGTAGTKLGAGIVAAVGDQEITRGQFEQVLSQARRSYKLQKRAFPKAGSVEYQQLVGQIVEFLAERARLAQKAKELGIAITDVQIDARLKQIQKQYFQGSKAKYLEQLTKQGLTEAQVRDDIRAQLVSEAIYKKVTSTVNVTDADIAKYYQENKSLYTTPEAREVRHILVKEKKLADQIYKQLVAGGDFAALAKKHSIDPGSKTAGGKLSVQKGQTVPEFDKAAFELKTNQISKPIKTQYGWHIIQPITEITPSKKTPLAKVKSSIKQQLEQRRKSEAMQKWLEGVKTEFAKKTKYAPGFAPPAPASTTTGTTNTNA